MTTQTDDGSPSSGLGFGLVVVAAGLTAAAAVYAYCNSPPVRGPSAADGARIDTHTHLDADTHTTSDARARGHAHAQDADAAARGVRAAEPRKVRSRKKKDVAGNEDVDGDADADGAKGKGIGKGQGQGQGQGQGRVKGQGRAREKLQDGSLPKTTVAIAVAVPGAFEAAVESPDAAVVAAPHSPAGTGTTSKPGDGGDKTEDKTNKRKKKKRVRQSKVRGRDGEDSGGEETEDGGVRGNARSKIGREAAAATAHGALHAGDSTDTDPSPSVSASTSTSIRAVGKGSSLRASTRPPPPSELHVQQRGAHAPSQAARESRLLHLSVDTDGSWTHVDRRQRLSKSSGPGDGDGRSGHPVDAIDVTSSDLASTESSGSPVAERTIESIAGGGRDTRADLAPRTLAEKLVPKPEKTVIEDTLEQSDLPTLSRVTRVQPRANESATLGFSSWEDSGDLGDEGLLAHETDQEDEGEWDIVKSRYRTRPAQTATTITTITNTTASTPEMMSKRQRQNARKRELAKSAKAEVETARREGLEKHQRELERLRIIDQAHRGGSGTGGGKRQPGGGMRAAVDDRGKLVWE